jgi:outer membrane protein TolC
MRAELRELDQAYKILKFAYEDQARLIGRARKATKTELERAQDAVRSANDAFDAARRALEGAVRRGVGEDE